MSDDATCWRPDGLWVAATTPFRDGRPDAAALGRNLRRYADAGVDGCLVLGSTAETVLLDTSERRTLLQAARVAMPSGVGLLAGVSAESTVAAIDAAREAAELGADACLIGTPHYFREQMDLRALERHFTAVADASPRPVMLYNVPKFTGLALPTELVLRLAAHPSVVGVKDSEGAMERTRRWIDGTPAGFAVACGAVSCMVEAAAAGASSAILAAATAFPDLLSAIWRDACSADAGRIEAASERLRVLCRHRPIVGGTGVAGFKAAMDLRGLEGGLPRPPLLPPEADALRAIAADVQALVDQRVLPRLELASG